MENGDIIELNGLKYRYSGMHYKRLDLIAGEPGKPEILCPKCHNDLFTISYGTYECIANCKCGHKMTIYEG